jgi:hypothetical protein
MPDNEMQNDLRTQWQSQPGEGGTMRMEDIRVEAKKFHDRIRRRNIREYGASLFTMLILIAESLFIPFPRPIRVALVMFIAGLFVFIYQLRKRGSPRPLPQNMSAPCLDFHRGALERQRDVLQGIWLWGILLPFGPGALVVIVSVAFVSPFVPYGLTMSLIMTAIFASMFIGFGKLNQQAARTLQRKIDELDT